MFYQFLLFKLYVFFLIFENVPTLQSGKKGLDNKK